MDSSDKRTRKAQAKDAGADSDRELFKQIIEHQHMPQDEMPGHDATRQLATSSDLQYRYRDMCTVSVSTVAEVMMELGYRFTFVMGLPYWELYDRIE
ncbi:MAG: hypothetical protein J5486_04250 [Bacteroidaceae bacterium]|nr:hypothetical protein [Bacteroidaceae bacterium]